MTATTLSRADAKLARRQAKEPPTDRQVAYLGWLGHAAPVTSRHEASDIIDRLTAERRLAGGRCVISNDCE